MQDCFRQHPDMYGAELEYDEDELEDELRAREAASSGNLSATPSSEPAETTEASQKVEEQIAEKSKPMEPSQQDSSSKAADNVQQVGDKEEEPTVHDPTSK
jgi:intermembrane space import and assembly protein 40